MPGIFISYRREDTQPVAARLADRLAQRFTPALVFRDVDAIPPGALVASVIFERIRTCDALLALIGPRWLDAVDPGTSLRRLESPNDYVRLEIAAALSQDKLVIPILVEAAPMPAAADLPLEIASLTDRNALLLTDARFSFDTDRLIATLEPAMVEPPQQQRSQEPPPPTPRWTYSFIALAVSAAIGMAPLLEVFGVRPFSFLLYLIPTNLQPSLIPITSVLTGVVALLVQWFGTNRIDAKMRKTVFLATLLLGVVSVIFFYTVSKMVVVTVEYGGAGHRATKSFLVGFGPQPDRSPCQSVNGRPVSIAKCIERLTFGDDQVRDFYGDDRVMRGELWLTIPYLVFMTCIALSVGLAVQQNAESHVKTAN